LKKGEHPKKRGKRMGEIGLRRLTCFYVPGRKKSSSEKEEAAKEIMQGFLNA